MAFLHLTFYSMMGRDMVNSMLPMPMVPPVVEERVEIDTASAQTDPFPEQAHFVMIKADVACCLAFGEDPVAEDGIHPVDAGEVRWYGVHPGHRIAVIELT